jgi:hypothetical protein
LMGLFRRSAFDVGKFLTSACRESPLQRDFGHARPRCATGAYAGFGVIDMSHQPDNSIVAAAPSQRALADDGALDARYADMCRAIRECHRVDEVKQIRDKVLALEVYARQAKNTNAERLACEIRLRAERRAGVLLMHMAKAELRDARGGDRKSTSCNTTLIGEIKAPPSLVDLGISRDQSSKWQKLAQVSEAEFESALGAPGKMPSTASLLKRATPITPPFSMTAMDGSTTMNPLSLWVWDVVRSFERKDLAHQVPAAVFGGMTATMQSDLARLVPELCDWFAHLPIEEVKQ